MIDQILEAVIGDAREALGGEGEAVNAAPGVTPRYELFHAANSICSQKVRVVLAHHRLPYVSRPVKLFEGQTYLPGYVRLRMLGCERFGGELVSHHSGSTSASEGGCDGAVVPTLVDHEAGEVIVDSKRICFHLDDEMDESAKLRPARLATAIDAELFVVDNLPNYQMLMGRSLQATDTPEARKAAAGAFSQRKVAWCDRYLAEHADEPALVRAYAAKRAKELSAATALFSPEAMTAAYARADAALGEFERKLESRADAWLFGDSPTMADLFWGIELSRMANVGAAHFWEGGRLPQVEHFAAATEALPAIRSAIIDWPGAAF